LQAVRFPRVNVIAHSMGNRAFIDALNDLAFTMGSPAELFNEVG
jgi:esterase/lipase superfamily enzyme